MSEKWALISVSDKQGIESFAQGLVDLGFGILSTGGTAKALRSAGMEVEDVSSYTGFPEMMDGRVKTLNPLVHGGLLGRRDVDAEVMVEHGIRNIDIVAVNLYPFREAVLRPGCTLEDAVENIDIGGPSMVRSAAKNHAFVTVVTQPEDYEQVLEELKANGAVSLDTRKKLAARAFSHTAKYDSMISQYFADAYDTPVLDQKESAFGGDRIQVLRYGENPHQSAVVLRDPLATGGITNARQLQGKELSYNNYLDLDSALRMVLDFDEPAAVVLKHTNPCGAALGKTPAEAYLRAREVDPVSAFGSVLGFNREVDAETATRIAESFVEAVVAPSFSDEALTLLETKKNLRLLIAELSREQVFAGLDVKRISGGYLLQEWDANLDPESEWKVVSNRQPTDAEQAAMSFGWRLVKHVKSNAVLFAGPDCAVGIGAGQMSRVDSSKIAVSKALTELAGTAVASDAFFPFRDGVDAAAGAGASCIIQPGGSIRDEEVIAAVNEHDMAMIFTGRRHFRHG